MGGIEIDYCQIFDKVNQGIFILDIETAKILNANKRATEITGYSVMELINEKPPLDCFLNKIVTTQSFLSLFSTIKALVNTLSK
jgi:PAS domain S-box-containing protein